MLKLLNIGTKFYYYKYGMHENICFVFQNYLTLFKNIYTFIFMGSKLKNVDRTGSRNTDLRLVNLLHPSRPRSRIRTFFIYLYTMSPGFI